MSFLDSHIFCNDQPKITWRFILRLDMFYKKIGLIKDLFIVLFVDVIDVNIKLGYLL